MSVLSGPAKPTFIELLVPGVVNTRYAELKRHSLQSLRKPGDQVGLCPSPESLEALSEAQLQIRDHSLAGAGPFLRKRKRRLGWASFGMPLFFAQNLRSPKRGR